jgi:hypothetical protein
MQPLDPSFLDLRTIAAGGLSAITLSLILTQLAKRTLEMWIPPSSEAHDILVEWIGVVISIGIVLAANFAVGVPSSSVGRPSTFATILISVATGLFIKYGTSGLYNAVTANKVDSATHDAVLDQNIALHSQITTMKAHAVDPTRVSGG